MRIELSDGNWVEVRDLDDLREADRQAVNASHTLVRDDEGHLIVPGDFNDKRRAAMFRRIITNWSFPEPLPSRDSKGLGRLTLGQARELRQKTQPWYDALAEREEPEEAGSDPTEDSAN